MLRVTLVGFWLLAAPGGNSPARDDLSAYETAAAKVGRDAEAHVRLALWCETHGLQAERLKHLAIAVQILPDHAIARGLLAQMADEGRWRRPEDVAARYQAGADKDEPATRYRERRDTVPDTAEAHWQLAGWCADEGLESEAAVHLLAVVRIDPTREEAWKKLGYRKQNGRWKSAEQAASERADADAQRKADIHWRPLLQKWKSRLSQKPKKGEPAEVEDSLRGVTDPRAVPSIWQVFASGGPDDQQRAVALLRQIDAPAASRALATMALFGASSEVRRLAAESLAGRDPREFAGLLIATLRDPVEYEVRPVAGPGSPGELYIHGKRANTRRFYAAPPSLARLRPTDVVGFDNNGLPVANRMVGATMVPLSAVIDQRQMGSWDLTGASEFFGNKLGMGDSGRQLGGSMVKNQAETTAIGRSLGRSASVGTVPMPLVAQVPVGQLMLQAEQNAALSQQRLLTDIAEIDSYNKDVNQINERATFVLKAAMGEDLGSKQADWLKWWTNLAETTSATPMSPREPAPEREDSQAVSTARARVPSFAGGTPVWTRSGLRPVEDLRAGDQVLTQDAVTGTLGYAPVLTIRHSRREPVRSVTIDDDILVATDLERFWIAGKGWVLTRDLGAGDVVRLLGGIARVSSADDAGTRPVYHVQVDEKRGIFVGRRGVMVHDGQVAQPVASPFDASTDRDGSRAGRAG